MSCEWSTAELLDRLQNGTHGGKGAAADQSIHGRMGLGTACKGETSRVKNVLIESSGGTKLCLGRRRAILDFAVKRSILIPLLGIGLQLFSLHLATLLTEVFSL
jgi:hypothetical protein